MRRLFTVSDGRRFLTVTDHRDIIWPTYDDDYDDIIVSDDDQNIKNVIIY